MADIGFAISEIKKGGRITRSGWDQHGVYPEFIAIVDAGDLPHGKEVVRTNARYAAFFHTRDSGWSMEPNYALSQADILADDWSSFR